MVFYRLLGVFADPQSLLFPRTRVDRQFANAPVVWGLIPAAGRLRPRGRLVLRPTWQGCSLLQRANFVSKGPELTMQNNFGKICIANHIRSRAKAQQLAQGRTYSQAKYHTQHLFTARLANMAGGMDEVR